MTPYIELPTWPERLPFRAFYNDGSGPVYPHRHRAIEIIEAVTNQTRIGVAGQTYTLNAGDIFFFPSGQPHYFLPTPNSIRKVFQFDLSLYDFQLMQTSLTTMSTALAHRTQWSHTWPGSVTKEVHRLLAGLFKAADAPNARATVIGDLYLLLDCFVHRLPYMAGPPLEKLDRSTLQAEAITAQLNMVYDYIDTHYWQPITLTDIADLLNFNPQYFARFFKRNTGSTFGHFLLDYRLMKASFTLVGSDATMPEIAESCGFQSVKTFHHEFKQHMGLSPLNYRKAQVTQSPN
ncbi:helix-turn-helix transcriptional regulator [Lacticaseibacillus absianus]|uniref:helix-turn-helix transcriptional regulator n=1 Tax=Lacticaseibacillus absianus TaxID=2729623 RepID=UPI0015CA98B5|nr:AraC family transcriptional regulator [Lacticaseibacillus absianus]